jgi:predicted  nucleic acid-binding Zn-ribbon protein
MNKLLFAIALAFFISIGLSPGHSDQKEQQTGAISAEVKKEAQETGGTKTSSVKAEAEKYEKKARKELNDLKKEVKKLQAKAKELNEDAKAKAKEDLQAFREKTKEAEAKLKSIKSVSGESWDKLKSEIDSAMDSLKNTYKKMASYF